MTPRTRNYTRRAFISDGAVFGASLVGMSAFGQGALNSGKRHPSGTMPTITLGVPDAFDSEARDRTLKTVQQIDKPMVVFKVVGAGRFEPKTSFPYVLNAIRRKDGLCVGVDNPAQMAENAELTRELS